MYVTVLTILLSYYIFSYYYKLHKKSWEYASIDVMKIILKIITISIVCAAGIQLLVFKQVLFKELIIIWLLQVAFVGGIRFHSRLKSVRHFSMSEQKKRTLIVGAGAAGTMIVRQLQNSLDTKLLPICFIDDDPSKHHFDIFNIPVVGGTDKIPKVVEELMIDNIVIAIPSLHRKELNNIFQECVKTNAKTQILPMIEDLASGKVSVKQFREVSVEDLLGREPVHLDTQTISASIRNKVVLVTGAGGSIGSEICRQISTFRPKKLILLGHGENSIYSIEMELKEAYKNREMIIISEIADIQDKKKMNRLMNKYQPEVVYHAAAHKHVPLMERNPEEAIKNNIIGTMNVANAAHANAVGTFVMVSSDKAVNPTSVMGATKRLAEMIIQDLNMKSLTKFAVVRFGNVLGSRGSVIPLFKKQIEKGGPVTVTHPDMVRYFMTIPEASRLVIQAGCLSKGGETFILDMGLPVKIVDLAKNLIQLSGNSVEEIGIEYTGIRAGEKLYEELLNENEKYEKQIHPKIYVGRSSNIYMDEIKKMTVSYALLDKESIRKILLELANRQSESGYKTNLDVSREIPVEA